MKFSLPWVFQRRKLFHIYIDLSMKETLGCSWIACSGYMT